MSGLEAQQKEIKRLSEWIEKWKNTPTKVASAHSKQMMIEHMVKIEKPRRFDTKTFRAMFTPRIESYNEVLNVKDLKIGYEKELAEVSFLLEDCPRKVTQHFFKRFFARHVHMVRRLIQYKQIRLAVKHFAKRKGGRGAGKSKHCGSKRGTDKSGHSRSGRR